ncbi:hypothetical protein, partial [Klebsiella pneumoniae]|uniref:hypothetical protein n=1 Tax=Klebsiella pneumoniae TaxID=573 RepID=UPI002730F5C3
MDSVLLSVNRHKAKKFSIFAEMWLAFCRFAFAALALTCRVRDAGKLCKRPSPKPGEAASAAAFAGVSYLQEIFPSAKPACQMA